MFEIGYFTFATFPQRWTNFCDKKKELNSSAFNLRTKCMYVRFNRSYLWGNLFMYVQIVIKVLYEPRRVVYNFNKFLRNLRPKFAFNLVIKNGATVTMTANGNASLFCSTWIVSKYIWPTLFRHLTFIYQSNGFISRKGRAITIMFNVSMLLLFRLDMN